MNLVVIQGEDLVGEYENANDKILFILKNQSYCENGKIIVKKFETEAEKLAYMQGFEDSDGWNKNHFIENERASEIANLIANSRIYIVRDNFFQEDMQSECTFKIFAGVRAYERAIFFLLESSNAQTSFADFLKDNGDFRSKDLFWEIEEQCLQMWSADSMDILQNIQELGKYANNFSEVIYKEREIENGVTGYYFENANTF